MKVAIRTLLTVIVALSLAGFAASAAGAGSRPSNLGHRPVMNFAQAQKAFKSPGMAYAPFIFWFWDEPLDPAKMAEMSRVMLSQGFNPGYAHARYSMAGTPGLPDSEWLTDRWFESFSAALKEAERRNGYLGYCDEYWWPSFQAHGRMLKEHPELRAQSLNWKVIDAAGGTEVTVPSSFFAVAAQVESPVVPADDPLPEMGKWIWAPNAAYTKHTCWLRKAFNISAGRNVTKAAIRITADNGYTLYVNGAKVGSGDDWYHPAVYDVSKLLVSGLNAVAVEASNVDGPSGVLLGMRVVLDDDTSFNLGSDGSWKATLRPPASGWKSAGFDDSSWTAARVIAGTNEGPWAGYVAGSSFKHQTIRSKTLQVIGDGDAFRWKVPEGRAWRVYVFNKYDHPGAFDGEQVNTIDLRTGKAFIDMALEPYAKHLSGSLGKSIPGDFIDNEGDYGFQLAWSDSLDQKYKERYGRDIRLWMPLMLDQDVEGIYAKARWDWFDLVSDLYSANFRAVTDWNEKHGAYTTGHVWEESIAAQVSCVGDHMKLLRALTMPGQDCLGTKSLHVHDFKEIASVAEFGNTRAATELMGAGGWGVFTPTFLKQSANAVTAWGMGHIIPHGVFATRKLTGNPWMPDWYSESPFFPWLHLWNDFVTRTSFINSIGNASPNVLLYNPLESAWVLTSADMLDVNMWSFDENTREAREANAIDRSYSKAIQDLTDGRVEFLVGDRKYLSEMTVKNGQMVRGALKFRTVVFPPLRIMPLKVARNIVAFAKQGGRVYALGSLPSGSSDNGMNDPEMIKLMKDLAGLKTFTRCSEEPTGGGLKPLIDRQAPGLRSPVRFISGTFPMLQSHRRIDNRDFFWLGNNSDRDSRTCEVVIAGAHGAASIWDCETGEMRAVPSKDLPSGSRVTLAFKPLEAYWLVFDPKKPSIKDGTSEVTEVAAAVKGPWTVKYDPSIQPVMEFSMKPGDEFLEGVQMPLDDWRAWGLEKFSGLLDYTTVVTVGKVDGRLRLDLGEVHCAAEVWVNGKPCGMRLWQPYEFDISNAVKTGANQVRVRVCNLINNSYGDVRESGLRGPVRLISVKE